MTVLPEYYTKQHMEVLLAHIASLKAELVKAQEGKHYIFSVSYSGEPDAGLMPFSEEIVVTVKSGDPGGDAEGESSFQEQMRKFINDWYGMGDVTAPFHFDTK